jgi:hypothetical protein
MTRYTVEWTENGTAKGAGYAFSYNASDMFFHLGIRRDLGEPVERIALRYLGANGEEAPPFVPCEQTPPAPTAPA